jgi:hypothetical protein
MFPSFDSKPLGLPGNTAPDAATNTTPKAATTASVVAINQNRRPRPRLKRLNARICFPLLPFTRVAGRSTLLAQPLSS